MNRGRRRLLAAGAAGVVAGCVPPGRSGELRYWTGWTGHELEAQKSLVAEFNAANPDAPVRVLSVANAYQKVRIAFAGGATPDVCSAVWADELAGYALRGVLTPLDDLLHESGRSLEEWLPGAARSVTFRGRPYGLTVTTNTNFLVYNRDIFREAGLDPDRPPATTDELDEAADRCTARMPDGTLRRYGFRPTGLALWALVFGGSWHDPQTGRVTADHPANVRALEWLASYARRYDVRRLQAFEAGFGGTATPNGPFFVGKVAMWQTGEYALEHLRRYAPGLDWGWCPLPYPPGGRPRTTAAAGSVFVIPAACPRPREAWRFLDWLTRPYAVSRFCREITNLPPLRVAARDPAFHRERLFSFALELAAGANAFGPPPLPIWPRYKREIARVEDFAVLGGGDPARLLADLGRRMSRELDRTLHEVG